MSNLLVIGYWYFPGYWKLVIGHSLFIISHSRIFLDFMVCFHYDMLKDSIIQSIQKAFTKSFNWQPESLHLTNPEPQFGDFALACHQFAKELKLPPQEIASKLAQSIKDVSI